MEQTVLEKMKALKNDNEDQFVSIFSNGEVWNESGSAARRIREEANTDYIFGLITNRFCEATSSYASDYAFDTMEMTLPLGLVFKKDDIDENKNVKEGCEPLDNVVRFYTGSYYSYLNGERTNTLDYGKYAVGSQGFINYDKLVHDIKVNGLKFEGPATFDEFKAQVLSSNPFTVTLVAQFNTDKEVEKQQEYTEEEPVSIVEEKTVAQEEQKSLVRRLFRK